MFGITVEVILYMTSHICIKKHIFCGEQFKFQIVDLFEQ